MKRRIEINNQKIEYTLLIKNVRNINLRIHPNGEIVVSCNAYVPIEKVDQMVYDKASWIFEKINQMNERRKRLASSYLYLGKQYYLQPILSSYSKVVFQNNQCMVYYTEKKSIEKVLTEFEINESKKLLMKKMDEVYETMVMDYPIIKPTLKIRVMSSRWGSCIPTKNQITLNRNLIHYQERFIDYVIYHEYAHLIQPNHSKAFYRVIEKYMPDYKEVSKNGPNLIQMSDENMI